MSEENQNPAPAAVESAKEFEAKLEKAYHERRRVAMRGGPVYHDPESAPLVWHDQLFEREITPSGTADCANRSAFWGTARRRSGHCPLRPQARMSFAFRLFPRG